MQDKKIHDCVWAYLQLNSYKTKDNERIVYKEQITLNKIADSVSNCISSSTVRKTIQLYIDKGIIKEGIAKDLYNREVYVYYLQQDFKNNEREFITEDTLKALVNINIDNTIKIYAYLLNKFKIKKYYKETSYNFTLKELCLAIGYTNRAENINKVKTIIEALNEYGLIEYHKSYYIGKTPKPLHVLTFIRE